MSKLQFKGKQVIIWLAALVVGAGLGLIGCGWLNNFMDFVASAYTRLFKFVAVPTVALAILTALASLGEGKAMGRVFEKNSENVWSDCCICAIVNKDIGEKEEQQG